MKIPYQYIEINPYQKAKFSLEHNPRGLVRTLGWPKGPDGKDTKSLNESNVICEFLNEVYEDEKKYGPNLYLADAYERPRCRIRIDHVNSRIVSSLYRFCQHQPHSSCSIEEARAEFLSHPKPSLKRPILQGHSSLASSTPWSILCLRRGYCGGSRSLTMSRKADWDSGAGRRRQR